MTYEEIKSYLSSFDSPVEKLEFVIDLGKGLDAAPNNAECSQILGCSSYVEFCRVENHFYGKADSALVAGIVAIIISMVQDKTPEEIKNLDLEGMFRALNLELGAARLNGIDSMFRFLRNL